MTVVENAVDLLRTWLTKHYTRLVRREKKNYEEMGSDIEDEYGERRWKEATLVEMCEELHQIIFDEHRGAVAVAGYFLEAGKLEEGQKVYNTFKAVEEHSH